MAGEPPISRDEVLVTMGALSDIVVTTQEMHGYLLVRTMKRKKKIADDWPERRERMIRTAQQLREFVAKGEAELKKKREREAS